MIPLACVLLAHATAAVANVTSSTCASLVTTIHTTVRGKILAIPGTELRRVEKKLDQARLLHRGTSRLGRACSCQVTDAVRFRIAGERKPSQGRTSTFGSRRRNRRSTGVTSICPWRFAMMRTNRLWRHLLAVSLATLGLSNATAKPRIVPLRTSATFSAQSPENRWSVPIKSPDGSTAYVLSLEPGFDVGHHVVTLELLLRRPGDKTL